MANCSLNNVYFLLSLVIFCGVLKTIDTYIDKVL